MVEAQGGFADWIGEEFVDRVEAGDCWIRYTIGTGNVI